MYIDIHQHLLYGIDDGPSSFEGTCRMLHAARKNGISAIVATAHVVPGLREFPLKQYLARLDEARTWCEANHMDIRLYAGSEVLFTDETPRLLNDGKILTLADTRNVLLEFTPDVAFERLLYAFRAVGNAGYTIVLAHFERYRCLRRLDRVALLRDEYGVLTQLNAGSLLYRNGCFTARWARKALDMDLVDVIASDAHNVNTRPCQMKACCRAIGKAFGEETIKELCVSSPQLILDDKDTFA